MRLKKVLLSLGTNIENKELNLFKAIIKLNDLSKVFIFKISSLYKTEPVGYLKQESFINCSVLISTNLKPYELLEKLQQIEIDMGRKKTFKWAPRNIDIDIIFYDDLEIKRTDLTIPHKEFKNRNFVLFPSNEIINSERIYKFLKKGHGKISLYKATYGLLLKNDIKIIKY